MEFEHLLTEYMYVVLYECALLRLLLFLALYGIFYILLTGRTRADLMLRAYYCILFTMSPICAIIIAVLFHVN